jgi:ADP-ribose pyrophosphatase YjhB (NUDIX family)
MKDPIFIKIYCVIYEGGQVIMTQDVEGQAGWKFPGGHVEESELLFEAAKREIKEEIGIEIAITGILLIEDYFNKKRPSEHNINFFVTAQKNGGETNCKKNEVARVSKFDIKEISKLDQFYPPHQNAINKLLSNSSLPETLSIFMEK